MTNMRQTSYEALMLDYAAGVLDMAQSLIVQTHLQLSPRGREIAHICDSVGSALLQSCEPVAMRENSLNRVLDMLDQEPATKQPCPPCEKEAILHSAGCCEKDLKWKQLYAGFKTTKIPMACKRSTARFVEIAPAVKTPQHRHGGLEITLVLNGAFRDEHGAYQRGDLVVIDEQDEHTPVACEKQGCFSMVVTSGPIRLSGWAALMNPFIRF